MAKTIRARFDENADEFADRIYELSYRDAYFGMSRIVNQALPLCADAPVSFALPEKLLRSMKALSEQASPCEG